MHSQQREHIATVMQVAEDGIETPIARSHDEIIRASWARCVHEHRLDPTRMQSLRAAQWNISAAARQLGISRMTLYRRMKRMGIESPNRQAVE